MFLVGIECCRNDSSRIKNVSSRTIKGKSSCKVPLIADVIFLVVGATAVIFGLADSVLFSWRKVSQSEALSQRVSHLDLLLPDGPDVLQSLPDQLVTVGTGDGPGRLSSIQSSPLKDGLKLNISGSQE